MIGPHPGRFALRLGPALGAISLITASFLGNAGPVLAQADSSGTSLQGLSRALRATAAKVGSAVVQIQVTAYGPLAGGPNETSLLGTQRSTGSGVILSADGYIVTNAHVVQGGRRFVVVLPRPAAPGSPGRSALAGAPQEVPAQLVGADRETDLAVLKVDLTDLPFASLGDSDSLQPGELVLAFGSPLGLANSVTMGVVSAVGRQLKEEDRMVYIQTDTPINPGNSGGPLVSADGLVVGINTLILSQSGGNEGIGFAAPSNIVRAVYEQLKTNKRVRRGEIGVFAQTITPALAEGLGLSRQWGAILGDVYPNGPAARAGLKVGDVILSVNGKQIENGRQFDVTLYRRAIGDQVTLEVARRLQRLTIRVAVVERRDDPDRFGDLVTPERNLVPRIGILGLDFTPELAQVIPGLRDPHGVVVAAVATESADGGEIVPGDVIHALNGTGILTLADLRKGIAALAPASSAVLQVERRGQYRFVTMVAE